MLSTEHIKKHETTPSYTETIRNIETVDELIEIWNEHPFAEVESNEPYKVGKDDGTEAERKAVKAEFLADTTGTIREPVFSYPHLDAEAMREVEASLTVLMQKAEELAGSDLESDLLYEGIARKAAELYRHREIARMHATEDPDAKRQSAKRAEEMTLELFGRPDPDTFNWLLGRQRYEAARIADESDNPEHVRLAQEFLDTTGVVMPPAGYEQPELTDEAIDVLSGDLRERYADELEIIENEWPDGQDKLSHKDALALLKKTIAARGLEGWDAEMTDGNAIETSTRRKKLLLGRNRALFNKAEFIKKDIHEGGHAERSYRGKQSEKPVAHTAFPGSLPFEEGLQTALEQVISGERKKVGEQYQLSCGLLLGMDRSGERRDFRDAYEVMWRGRALQSIKEGKPVETEKLQDLTYQATLRVKRGGIIDTRDLSYHDGFKKAVPVLNEIARLPSDLRKQAIEYIFSAKFDPTNHRHVEYMAA